MLTPHSLRLEVRVVLDFDLAHPTLRLGLVRASAVRAAPSDEALASALSAIEARFMRDETALDEAVRRAVRDVLRVGGYKPTGRGKPASELLAGLAKSGNLPRIGNLVDCNNLASLESALPVSMFDLARLGANARVRFGRPGESYVFNASGHAMDVEGLPVVCRGDEPVGNAVRDSMTCKVDTGTTEVLAVVYGSANLASDLLGRACERLRGLLEAHASARDVTVAMLPPA